MSKLLPKQYKLHTQRVFEPPHRAPNLSTAPTLASADAVPLPGPELGGAILAR